MDRIDESDIEVFGFDPAVAVDLYDLACSAESVLFEFLLDQRFGKARCIDLLEMY